MVFFRGEGGCACCVWCWLVGWMGMDEGKDRGGEGGFHSGMDGWMMGILDMLVSLSICMHL